MADHGEIQYATADGNDLPVHEANYESFIHAAAVGTMYVVNILIALTLGGVMGRWLPAAAILIIGAAVLAASLWTGSRTPSIVMVGLSALTLLFNAYS